VAFLAETLYLGGYLVFIFVSTQHLGRDPAFLLVDMWCSGDHLASWWAPGAPFGWHMAFRWAPSISFSGNPSFILVGM